MIPDFGENPRLDTFQVDLDDCGPMVLDALIWIKNNINFDADLPPFVPRRHLRFLRYEHGRDELARLHTLHLGPQRSRESLSTRELDEPSLRISFPTSLILYAQYELIEPWLQSKTPEPQKERPQSHQERSELDGYYECILSLLHLRLPEPLVEIRAASWGPPRYFRLGDGSATAAMKPPNSASTIWRIHFGLYRCHTILNCTRTCPKELNPGKAIAEIKKRMIERRS